MKIRIVTNISDGKGLWQDYLILRRVLQELGHEVIGNQFNQPPCGEHCDINIFLETIEERFFRWADRQWVFPNPEWWMPEYDLYLPVLERICCKTPHAYELFADKSDGAELTGFMAHDKMNAAVERHPAYLHIAGGSQVKNTDAILAAWQTGEVDIPLIVVGRYWSGASNLNNVKWMPYVSREELTGLQNACLYHLMPSQYEGYGHVVHEALSVGAILLTLDHPSLDHLPAVRTKPKRTMPYRLATLAVMDKEDVFALVKAAAVITPTQMVSLSQSARKFYEKECRDFRENMEVLL